MLIGKRIKPAIYRDGMAQTNGDPIEDVPDDITAVVDNINHGGHDDRPRWEESAGDHGDGLPDE